MAKFSYLNNNTWVIFMSPWQLSLYYPLGLLSTFFFFLRFLTQWIKSEKKKESYVTPSFWWLSLAGNTLAVLHYFIQSQYLFLLLQVGNLNISWRNLNLLYKGPHSLSFKKTVFIFATSLIAISLAFFLQQWLLFHSFDFLSSPLRLVKEEASLSSLFTLHLVGILGSFLFGSRFWIQWWHMEHSLKSELNARFWMLSLIGSTLLALYSLITHDRISLINYSFGVIPYLRNLVLLRRRYSTVNS